LTIAKTGKGEITDEQTKTSDCTVREALQNQAVCLSEPYGLLQGNGDEQDKAHAYDRPGRTHQSRWIPGVRRPGNVVAYPGKSGAFFCPEYEKKSKTVFFSQIILFFRCKIITQGEMQYERQRSAKIARERIQARQDHDSH
jgi:hypothetical protein